MGARLLSVRAWDYTLRHDTHAGGVRLGRFAKLCRCSPLEDGRRPSSSPPQFCAQRVNLFTFVFPAVVSVMASPSVKLKYKLSSELIGHSGDVRAVSCLVDQDVKTEYIVTASRDRTAIIWSRPFGQREFNMRKRLAVHDGYVSALCMIPPDPAIGRGKREWPILFLVFSIATHSIVPCRLDSNGEPRSCSDCPLARPGNRRWVRNTNMAVL